MPKKDVSLVVCDIDNTISDTFNLWGEALDKAVDDLAALHKTDRKTMEETLLAAVPENNRGSSGPLLGINIRADIAQTPALQGNTPEEKAFFEKEHEKIIHNWQKKRDEAVLFKGVLPVIQKIKAAGAKFVLYTDARESGCLPRLAKLGINPDMIDALYVQPDKEGMKITPFAVKSELSEFKKAMQGKIFRLPAHSSKPNAENMANILKDFGISADKTVMVGDNIRCDGGSAAAVGASFAWQKQGAEVTKATRRCYARFAANPNYKIGIDAHLSQMNETNKPEFVLENGFADLSKYCRFVSAQKSDEKTLSFALLKRLGKSAGKG